MKSEVLALDSLGAVSACFNDAESVNAISRVEEIRWYYWKGTHDHDPVTLVKRTHTNITTATKLPLCLVCDS